MALYQKCKYSLILENILGESDVNNMVEWIYR